MQDRHFLLSNDRSDDSGLFKGTTVLVVVVVIKDN